MVPEVCAVHMGKPDFVPYKTALRSMSERIKNEARAAEHWANITKNRGMPVVSVRLEDVASALKTAFVNCEAALERLSEIHEMSVSEEE